MLFNKSKLYIPIILIFLGCGSSQKSIKRNVIIANPESFVDYYNIGKTAYAEGNIVKSIENFNKSVELNPTFSSAYEELGKAYYSLNSFDDALYFFEKSIKINGYSIPSLLHIGRINLSRNEFNTALEYFNKIMEFESNNAEAHFYKGMTYYKSGNNYRGMSSFVRAINIDNSYRDTVGKMFDLTDKNISNIFKIEYLAIENKREISRGELSALLDIIVLNNTLSKKVNNQTLDNEDLVNSIEVINDVPLDHWSINAILNSANSGLIELFPGNNFRPEEKILKTDFSSVLQKIIIKYTGDRSLLSKYLGEISPFEDINSSHWAYNAIKTCIDYQLIKPKNSTEFGINDGVSGIEAINALNKILNFK